MGELSADSHVATGTELHQKFMADGEAFTLKYNGLNTFFGGLEAKIGPPNPKLFETMEMEHCKSADSKDPFTTRNYGITTTAEQEWWFVAEPHRDHEWPEEAILAES